MLLTCINVCVKSILEREIKNSFSSLIHNIGNNLTVCKSANYKVLFIKQLV